MRNGPLFETTPQQVSPEISRFCQGIVPGGVPVFVPVRPMAGAEAQSLPHQRR